MIGLGQGVNMQKTFDHLLGLSARSALAVLAGYGITDVRLTLTGAPAMWANAPASHSAGTPAASSAQPPERRVSALEGIASQFSAGDGDEDDGAEESGGFDPLLDSSRDDGMLVEARVVAVRDDGRQLVVARFHVGQPKPGDSAPR